MAQEATKGRSGDYLSSILSILSNSWLSNFLSPPVANPDAAVEQNRWQDLYAQKPLLVLAHHVARVPVGHQACNLYNIRIESKGSFQSRAGFSAE